MTVKKDLQGSQLVKIMKYLKTILVGIAGFLYSIYRNVHNMLKRMTQESNRKGT